MKLAGFAYLNQDQRRVFRNNSRRRAIDQRILHIRRLGLRYLRAKSIFMTSKEKAELLFKQKRLSGSRSSIPEYEQRARAERTKIAELRKLRLAREAELAPKPLETGRAAAKRTPQKS
jgi:hypothetical protein